MLYIPWVGELDSLVVLKVVGARLVAYGYHIRAFPSLSQLPFFLGSYFGQFYTKLPTLKERGLTRLLKYYYAFRLLLVVHITASSLLSSRRSSPSTSLSLLALGSKC